MSAPESIEEALRARFGHEPDRASVSFLGVEPIEVLRFVPARDQVAYVTLGMSRRPMTRPSELVLDSSGPRAELMLLVRIGGFDDVWRSMGLLAATPAVEGVVYAPGMTADLGATLASGSRCSGVVVVEPELSVDGPIDVLRVIPATANELAWARVHGVEALRALWDAHQCDLLDLGRVPVPLP